MNEWILYDGGWGGDIGVDWFLLYFFFEGVKENRSKMLNRNRDKNEPNCVLLIYIPGNVTTSWNIETCNTIWFFMITGGVKGPV